MNVTDCLSKSHLGKLDQQENYLFLLLRLPVYAEKDYRITSTRLSMFLGRNYLISMHEASYKPLADLFQSVKTNEAIRQTYLGESSAHLLYHILLHLVDQLSPFLDRVMKELDQVEDGVYDQRVSVARDLSRIRMEIADLGRIIFPLRRLMEQLPSKAQQYSIDDMTFYSSDLKDHLEKAWETLDELKDTVEIYKDTDYILSSERSNTILALLTILFTLTIPVTVIGTLYGMNVPLPGGLVTGPWTFLGIYTTLIVILVASVVPSVLMVWYFRRMGWF
jgi:magnesium transporter